MDGNEWVLVIMAVGVVLQNFLSWKGNEAAKVRDAAAQAAAALLARETAEVKATQEKVLTKTTQIVAATDGVNSALTDNARTAADTIRRLELIIAGFVAQSSTATPALLDANGREHPPEPIPVYTAPGDAVIVAGDDAAPVPVETVRKNAAKE